MHGRNYREVKGMAYTRKDFAPGTPQSKIAKFSTGTPGGDYDLKFQLVSTERLQIRHNALEAARVAVNKKLSTLGETNYHLLVKVYPHIILRENRMIATAGADRLQEGMRKAFGKPMGLAARVEQGSVLLELITKKEFLEQARDALRTASSKLPMPTTVSVVELKRTTQN